MTKNAIRIAVFAISLFMIGMTEGYADENTELAKQLTNPIASLISLPLQYNYDSNIGLFDTGSRSFLNIQPVIPVSLNNEWNIISRTILPVVWQKDIVAGSGIQKGFGNVTQSFFFSPKLSTENGWIWGVGPIFVLPTATDELIGGSQWAVGPTGVALKQSGPWTYGGLANHVWSFASDNNTQINSTFLQPFLAYVTPGAVTYSINTESIYSWKTKEWAVPLNFIISKMMMWDDQHISISGGIRYWAVSDSDFTPEGWGLRMNLTFLFPK